MLSRFFKFKIKKKNIIEDNRLGDNSDGWLIPQSAAELLNTPLRKKLLTIIYQKVSMSEEMFNQLFKIPIERYAELVQLFPASENHHHSHHGGMLDHGLEVISIAAKLRQNYLLPLNSAPEDQAKQSEVWTAAAIYGALTHDIGKIAVDIEIETENGRWYPWLDKLEQSYRFKYIKGRDYKLHPVLGTMIATKLIPPIAFNWLAKYPDAFSSLAYLMSGHYDKAGILGEIIQKADQASVAHYLGGDITKVQQQPQQSLPKQFIIALRHLLEKDLKLNSPQGGSDGWLTDEALWLMSKSVTDKVRSYLMQQGISVPMQNGRIFDEMQAHGILEATPANTAIWVCRIQSNAGWKPANTFTLLKITPSLIWENIEQRPTVFDGIVEIDIAKMQEKEPAQNIITAQVIESDSQGLTAISQVSDTTEAEPNEPKIQTQNAVLDDIDFTMNLFNNIEQLPAEKPNNQLDRGVIDEIEQNKSIIGSNDIKELDINPTDFVEWIKQGIILEKLSINRTNSVIHIVEQHAFIVSPGIFKRYIREKFETGDKEVWRELQKRFQRLGIHKKKSPEGLNIWTCQIVGPHKTTELKGYLIDDLRMLFGDRPCFDNLYLKLKEVSHE
ncbi:MobH family relaxase [Testudinibacter sp. P80/BLE/0925]|uniref:MobH family relaxase n=1 Tax=Testudinibacter sp. TW-1 TaxID=3417757 RepID=UPI003D3655F0